MKPFDEKENEKAKRFLLKSIKDVAIFIGSRAWGVEREDSDYDYLISYDKLKKIFETLERTWPAYWECKQIFEQSWGDSCDQERQQEFYSIIITINQRRYNIIAPMDMINYRAWKSAAMHFESFIGYEVIKEKRHRVELFECLKKIHRDISFLKQRKKEEKDRLSKPDNDLPF